MSQQTLVFSAILYMISLNLSTCTDQAIGDIAKTVRQIQPDDAPKASINEPTEDAPKTVKQVSEEDASQAVCMPMMMNRVVTADMKAKFHKFQNGWKDTGRFKKLKLTAKESLWLSSLSVESSPRLSRGRQVQASGITGKNGRDCYHIPGPMRIRKEYRQLKLHERQSFHKALNSLKSVQPDPDNDPGTSGYDLLVGMHRYESASSAHSGAAFLPWHREYLIRLENALYDNGYTGPGLPYWDSTLDQSLPDASHSVFFSAEYIGNNDGYVTSGPAANWTTIKSCHYRGKSLKRNTYGGSAGQSYLYSDQGIQENVFNKTCFKDIVCSEDCGFESDHGMVHVFINGHMGEVTCAPSDPIFFLHHCFVDCIWEQFRQKYQKTHLELEYPSRAAHKDHIGYGDHEWDDPMKPFDGLINAHGMSNHYTNYYFKYEDRPSRCIASHQCKSDALWCDRRACRCRSKIRLGGNCENLPHMACAGSCNNGKSPICKNRICQCKK